MGCEQCLEELTDLKDDKNTERVRVKMKPKAKYEFKKSLHPAVFCCSRHEVGMANIGDLDEFAAG